MFFVNLFKPPKPTHRSFVKYKAIPQKYDPHTRKWTKDPSHLASSKTTDLFKKRQSVKLIGQAKPGERLFFTEKQAYRKERRSWVLISSTTFDFFTSFFRTMVQGPPPTLKRPQTQQEGVEVVVIKEKIPNTKRIIKQVQKIDATIADLIREKDGDIKKLLVADQKLMQSGSAWNSGPRVRLSARIEKEVMILKQHLRVAKSAIKAEEHFNASSDSESDVQPLARGAVKEVKIRKSERRSRHRSVYFVAGKSLGESVAKTGSKEIAQEVVIANRMRRNLYEQKLQAILETKLTKESAARLTDELIRRFPTADELAIGLQVYDKQSLAYELGIRQPFVINGLMEVLPKNIEALKGLGNHIATELELLPEEEQIKGKLTVKAPMAEKDDLEKRIRKQKVSMEARIGYGAGTLRGMADMHASGHVHGDLKPENILIYKQWDGTQNKEQEVVKIADFGKVVELSADETGLYKGNPRFAPSERTLSQQGEVYSTAMVLIRIFEEPVLDPASNMVLSLKKEELDSVDPKAGRRGIEKFAIQSKNMPQSESTLKGRIKLLAPSIPFVSPSPKESEKEIHNYISRLKRKLIAGNHLDVKEALKLETLLKKMTDANPKKRPTMAEASAEYQVIFS